MKIKVGSGGAAGAGRDAGPTKRFFPETRNRKLETFSKLYFLSTAGRKQLEDS
jgi:hypothetical protein